MNRLLWVVFPIILYSYASLHGMHGKLVRCFSTHPQKIALQDALKRDNLEHVKEVVMRGIAFPLIELYDYYLKAKHGAIKCYFLEAIKLHLKAQIEAKTNQGLNYFQFTFLELSKQLSRLQRPKLDVDFLRMLTQLKNEVATAAHSTDGSYAYGTSWNYAQYASTNLVKNLGSSHIGFTVVPRKSYARYDGPACRVNCIDRRRISAFM